MHNNKSFPIFFCCRRMTRRSLHVKWNLSRWKSIRAVGSTVTFLFSPRRRPAARCDVKFMNIFIRQQKANKTNHRGHDVSGRRRGNKWIDVKVCDARVNSTSLKRFSDVAWKCEWITVTKRQAQEGSSPGRGGVGDIEVSSRRVRHENRVAGRNNFTLAQDSWLKLLSYRSRLARGCDFG